MWSENSGSLPDPDTLIQFLLTPMKTSPNEENVPKKNDAKVSVPESSAVKAGDGDDVVNRRIALLEQRLDALRQLPPPPPQQQQTQQQQTQHSRSPSPPVKDGKEKRVTFAVRDSERSTTSESEALMTELASDPEVMAMVSQQHCKLCSAYAQRYREEQRERVKQEVTCATLGQALCGAEQERDKLKSGLSHIQTEIQRMKEETVRLEATREKTGRELRRSEEDRSDLQLKLKVMSECVRKRDLELSIQRQALDDRDRRLKDSQNEGLATSNKLLMVQEQLHHLRAEHTNQTQKVSELKDLLAEREKQHMLEMKKRNGADNPSVQKLIQKAADEARSAAMKEANTARHKADKEANAIKKESERMASALSKFKSKFTELVDEKSALAEQLERQKAELNETLSASKTKDSRVSELNKTLKTVRDEIDKLETQRKNDQTTHTAAVAFLENKVKQLETSNKTLAEEKSGMVGVKAKLEETEKRHSEEVTLRKAGEARLAILKKQLDELTGEQSSSLSKLQAQTETLKTELTAAQEKAASQEKLAASLTEQLRTVKQGGASSRGRGDASSELETERRRCYRLQVELDRLTENKAQLMARLEHAERELDRCAKENEGWSKLWEEKVELIRKLEAQVKMGRSINEDKVASLRQERDRAMELAKQAAKKLQTLDSEYQVKMDEMRALFEAQLDGVRSSKDTELHKSAERVREIESMLKEVSAETAASRSSLEEKMRRINLITKGFDT